MTGKPLLFHQTAEQLRRVSAHGGPRQRTQPARPLTHHRSGTAPALPPPQPQAETTAAAIAALEAQFPWLCSKP
jgi:hypothetical protein